MLSTLLSQSSLQWPQVNIISNIIFVWDHPFKTSANFLDFWPLPPFRRQFFTTIRWQIWPMFDPSPKKCLLNGWSLWVVPELSQGCPMAIPGLSQGCFRAFPGLFKGVLKVFPEQVSKRLLFPRLPHPIAYLVNSKAFQSYQFINL